MRSNYAFSSPPPPPRRRWQCWLTAMVVALVLCVAILAIGYAIMDQVVTDTFDQARTDLAEQGSPSFY